MQPCDCIMGHCRGLKSHSFCVSIHLFFLIFASHAVSVSALPRWAHKPSHDNTKASRGLPDLDTFSPPVSSPTCDCVRCSYLDEGVLAFGCVCVQLLCADQFLITEFVQEVSPLSPNPCHFQDYGRSMLYPAQSGSEGCSPKMCADEVNAEEHTSMRRLGRHRSLLDLQRRDMSFPQPKIQNPRS